MQIKRWVAIPVSDKTDFKTQAITRDGKHFIMTNISIQQDDITCKHLCTQCRSDI